MTERFKSVIHSLVQLYGIPSSIISFSMGFVIEAKVSVEIFVNLKISNENECITEQNENNLQAHPEGNDFGDDWCCARDIDKCLQIHMYFIPAICPQKIKSQCQSPTRLQLNLFSYTHWLFEAKPMWSVVGYFCSVFLYSLIFYFCIYFPCGKSFRKKKWLFSEPANDLYLACNLTSVSEDSSTESWFLCAICNSGFLAKFNLNKHMRKFHPQSCIEEKKFHKCETYAIIVPYKNLV